MYKFKFTRKLNSIYFHSSKTNQTLIDLNNKSEETQNSIYAVNQLAEIFRDIKKLRISEKHDIEAS